MSRWPRIVLPGVPMHITHRGNDRETIFRSAGDFAQYRDTLIEAGERTGCTVHAYALMTNHVHLLLTPGASDATARLMRIVGSRFVRYLNLRYRRTGTRWEGRFKSSVVDTDRYLLTCSRYIELNPVRAGIVDAPEAYQWSSYRRLALGESDPLITPHAVYESLGATARERQQAYRSLFVHALPDQSSRRIRHAALGGSALGSARFCARLGNQLDRRACRLSHGGDRRSRVFADSQTL